MNTAQEKKGLEQLRELSNNPLYRSKRYHWLSIFSIGFGFFIPVQIFLSISKDYQPVTHLIYWGIFSGFLIGIGFYFTAVKVGSEFLSPYLDKEKLEKRINEINT